MSILFVIFGAIFLIALVAGLRELRSEGIPRGNVPFDFGADGQAETHLDLSHGGVHCDHGGHDGGGGFDGGGGHH